MYNSLFSDLKPLVFGGESGVLDIRHNMGAHARIYLKEGLVEGVTSGKLKGAEAAKTCAGWTTFSSQFLQGVSKVPEGCGGVNTNSFLELLEKVDTRLKLVQSVIPGREAIFKADPDKLGGGGNFTAQDMKVALLLDGKRSVEVVMAQAGLSEIAVLSALYKLNSQGIAKLVAADKPMDAKKREDFLNSLQDRLADVVGPVADMLIQEALDDMGCERDCLSEKQVPRVIESICNHLDDKECAVLKGWADNTLKQ